MVRLILPIMEVSVPSENVLFISVSVFRYYEVSYLFE